ncbi:unnamed protein product [Amoebophrya sp. A120]|nr:unnamed protein product [Amoebophrya sp. A120]|eukprot:GSA120T00004302001.1
MTAVSRARIFFFAAFVFLAALPDFLTLSLLPNFRVKLMQKLDLCTTQSSCTQLTVIFFSTLDTVFGVASIYFGPKIGEWTDTHGRKRVLSAFAIVNFLAAANLAVMAGYVLNDKGWEQYDTTSAGTTGSPLPGQLYQEPGRIPPTRSWQESLAVPDSQSWPDPVQQLQELQVGHDDLERLSSAEISGGLSGAARERSNSAAFPFLLPALSIAARSASIAGAHEKWRIPQQRASSASLEAAQDDSGRGSSGFSTTSYGSFFNFSDDVILYLCFFFYASFLAFFNAVGAVYGFFGMAPVQATLVDLSTGGAGAEKDSQRGRELQGDQQDQNSVSLSLGSPVDDDYLPSGTSNLMLVDGKRVADVRQRPSRHGKANYPESDEENADDVLVVKTSTFSFPMEEKDHGLVPAQQQQSKTSSEEHAENYSASGSSSSGYDTAAELDEDELAYNSFESSTSLERRRSKSKDTSSPGEADHEADDDEDALDYSIAEDTVTRVSSSWEASTADVVRRKEQKGTFSPPATTSAVSSRRQVVAAGSAAEKEQGSLGIAADPSSGSAVSVVESGSPGLGSGASAPGVVLGRKKASGDVDDEAQETKRKQDAILTRNFNAFFVLLTVSISVGPSLGVFVVDHTTGDLTFLLKINAMLALAAVLVGYRTLPDDRPSRVEDSSAALVLVDTSGSVSVEVDPSEVRHAGSSPGSHTGGADATSATTSAGGSSTSARSSLLTTSLQTSSYEVDDLEFSTTSSARTSSALPEDAEVPFGGVEVVSTGAAVPPAAANFSSPSASSVASSSSAAAARWSARARARGVGAGARAALLLASFRKQTQKIYTELVTQPLLDFNHIILYAALIRAILSCSSQGVQEQAIYYLQEFAHLKPKDTAIMFFAVGLSGAVVSAIIAVFLPTDMKKGGDSSSSRSEQSRTPSTPSSSAGATAAGETTSRTSSPSRSRFSLSLTFSNRKIIRVGLFLNFLHMCILTSLYYVPSFPLAMVAEVLVGVSFPAVACLSSMVGTHAPKDQIGRAQGFVQSAGQVGRIMGPVMFALLYAVFRKEGLPQLPYAFGAVMVFCAFLVSWRKL